MICKTCHGMGWLLTALKSGLEWWACPACSGAGARIMYGPVAWIKKRSREINSAATALGVSAAAITIGIGAIW